MAGKCVNSGMMCPVKFSNRDSTVNHFAKL